MEPLVPPVSQTPTIAPEHDDQFGVPPIVTRVEKRGRGRPKKAVPSIKKKGIGKREFARLLSDESSKVFGKYVVSYRVFGMFKMIASHFAAKTPADAAV